jgi:putative heme-binding domain-containing protein
LLADAEFGRPDHAMFAHVGGFDRKQAANRFLERAASDADFAWNGELVQLVGSLPAEQALPRLRALWGQAGVDDAILPVLARHADALDRDRLVTGLGSTTLSTVRACIDALEKLPLPPADEKEALALVLAMRRLGTTAEDQRLEGQMSSYLTRLMRLEKAPGDRKAWAEWVGKTYPKSAARLDGPDGVDVEAWKRRLAKIDWSAGDGPRGQGVFTRVGCASCHSGARALGPDLTGVAGRFSRDDLLTAIIQPSKDISPRYRTIVLETDNGKVYQGLIIYESPDGTLLQTGPSVTVRVVNAQVVNRRTSDLSLMPVGLLDKVSDGDIADLLAYLKSLSASAPKQP